MGTGPTWDALGPPRPMDIAGPYGPKRVLLRSWDEMNPTIGAEVLRYPATDPCVKEAFAKAFAEAFGKAVSIDRDRALPPPSAPAAASVETESPEARAERIWRITQSMAR